MPTLKDGKPVEKPVERPEKTAEETVRDTLAGLSMEDLRDLQRIIR